MFGKEGKTGASAFVEPNLENLAMREEMSMSGDRTNGNPSTVDPSNDLPALAKTEGYFSESGDNIETYPPSFPPSPDNMVSDPVPSGNNMDQYLPAMDNDTESNKTVSYLDGVQHSFINTYDGMEEYGLEDYYIYTYDDLEDYDTYDGVEGDNLKETPVKVYGSQDPPTYDVEETATVDVDEKDFPGAQQGEDGWHSTEGSSHKVKDIVISLEDIYQDLEDIRDKLPDLDLQVEDLLSQIAAEKMKELEELIMLWLKAKMAGMYNTGLRSLDHTRSRIDGTAYTPGAHPPTGSPGPAAGTYGAAPVEATVPGEFWQPYIFDTGIGNRRDVKIEGVEVKGTIGGAKIAKIISVNLPGMAAICVSPDGLGYVELEGRLEQLFVMNKWTRSSSGCQCGNDYTKMGCACCVPGGCLCQGASDTCVACGKEHLCHSSAVSAVPVAAAAGTVLSAHDGSLHLSVLAVAYAGTVNFFSHVSGGASLQWVGSLTLQQEVTHLAFGTIFIDHDEATMENSFLVVFSSGARHHQFHEIVVSSMVPTFTVGPPVKWEARGETMRVHQNGNHVLVSVHGKNYIDMYSLQEDMWMKRHILREHTFKGAFNSWLVFTVDFETYLCMAARRHLVFYHWNSLEEEFEQLNTLYMDGSLSNIQGLVDVNIESCKEEVSVVVAGRGRDVAVLVLHYNFTTARHSFAVEFQGSLHAHLDWSVAASHSRGSSKLLALDPGKGEVVVVKVKAVVMDVEHPMGTRQRDVIDNTIDYIKKEDARQQSIVAAAEARLAQSVLFRSTVAANVTVTGSLTVTGVLSTGHLSAVRLVFPGTELERGVTLLEYLHHLQSFRPSLDLSQKLLQNISNIEMTLISAVPLSGPNRTIEGLKTIVATQQLVLNSVIIESMTVGRLLDGSGADFSLNSTLSAIIRNHQPGRIIHGRKTFASRLTIEHLHTSIFDDIPTNDLVTVSGSQSIAGAVFARGLWAREVRLSAGGTVAGIDLTRVVLLGQSALLGRVTFKTSEFVARAVDVLGSVGGIDLTRLFKHSLLVTGAQFTGSLVFPSDLMVDHLVANTMMGVDMKSLADTVVYKDEDAVLTGRLKVVQTVTVEGNMVTNTIHGWKFPEDFAVKVGTSPLVFTSELSFGHVAFGEVDFGPKGLVDGIAPHRLVTKSTDQTVTGTKVFTVGADITGHLDITTKLLDGINLDDLFSRGGRPSTVPADWKFNLICKRDIWIHRLITKGTVNSVDFSALARDIVYRHGKEVIITGRKVFLKGLSISNARFQGGFNGVDLSTFVTTDTDLVFGGSLIFGGDVFFKSLVARRISGVDLQVLIDGGLHLNKAGQVVTGQKVFKQRVVCASLVIEGSVKGVDLRNFVTKSGNQTFTAPQVFRTASFSTLRANSIHLSDGLKINGVDLSALAQKRVPLSEPVSHSATLTIEGALEVDGVASIKILNGLNLDDLLSTIVTDEGNFTIDGPVSLSSMRVLGSITTQGGVGASGVRLRNVANKAIKLSANNKIGSHLSFSTVEVRGDLLVDGLVEGVNLRLLHQDAVYTNVQTLQTITGVKMFDEGFTVRGNIHTRTTNDVDLSVSLFTRTTDQVVSARVSFLNVVARQNVLLFGLFNNFDLKALAEDSLIKGKNEDIVTGDITFSGRVTVKHLVIRGSLHGSQGSIDLSAHLTDAVRLQDTAITVTGKKTFTSGLSFGNLHVEILDGRKLDHFLAMVVTRNRPHTLTGKVRVQGTITAPWVTAQQLLVKGPIDGVDLEALRKVVVFLNARQTVDASLVFRQAVFVRGNLQTVFLNDISLADGYLTTSTEQTFNVNLTISSALATRVEVNGLVNSFNLPQEWNRTLLALGGQNIHGKVILSGRILVKKNVVVTGRVGRERLVKLSQQVVLLNRRTQVTGTLRFTAPLTVAWLKSSTGVVNGVDLTSLYRSAWFVDTTTAVKTSVAFQRSVVIKRGFFSQGTIDGLDVERAYNEARAARDGFRNVTVQFEAQFERICHPIARLYNKLEACMLEGNYLAFHGSLSLSHVPHESISFYAFGTTVLLVSYEGACHMDFLTWQNDNFVLHTRLQHVGLGRHFHLLTQAEDEVLVAMAASRFNNSCEQTNTTIWKVTASGIEVHQQLGEAMYITEEKSYGASSLLLHNLHYTLAYTLDPATQHWTLQATLPPHAGGVFVHPTYGVIHLLQDYTNATTYVRRAVHATSRGGLALLFALFSTVTSCRGPVHSLKVFRDIDGSHHCVAEAALPTFPADLEVFFAGSKAAGSHLAVVTMRYNHFPIIYSFAGEVLSRWGEVEAAPTATWVQHALVRRHGRHFPDHYIIFSPLQHMPETPSTTVTKSNQTAHYTPPTTPNPYKKPNDNPYTPPTAYQTPYTPPTTTPHPYNPYTTPGYSPNPYTPPSYSPNPYTPPTTPPHYGPDRYVRSATYDFTTPAKITAVYRLVMRGSAVAAANITCTRS